MIYIGFDISIIYRNRYMSIRKIDGDQSSKRKSSVRSCLYCLAELEVEV